MPSRATERTLTKSGSEPLYRQLYARLRSRIQTGEFQAGDAIPPESALMSAYGVSRITVRAALDQLVREGVIERQRGRGSFVRDPDPEARSCLSSFTEQMHAVGREPTTDVVRLEPLPGAERARVELPFDADTTVVLIERLRSVDGEVAGLVRTYLPHPAVATLRREHFARRGRGQSLLYVLEHVCGIVLDKGEETTTPVVLPADVAGRLASEAGSAALLKTCKLADVHGRTLLYEEAYWSAAQTQLVQRYPAFD